MPSCALGETLPTELSVMKSIRATMAFLLKRSNLLLILFGCVSLIIFSWSLRAHSSADMPWFLRLVLIESFLFIAASWVKLGAQANSIVERLVKDWRVICR